MSLDKSKLNKDTFCIAPWISTHFGVHKEVMPCCKYDYFNPLDTLTNIDDVSIIYNNDNSKNLRNDLFNGIKNKSCSMCWKEEELSESESYRQFHNRVFKQSISHALKNTNDDFSLKTIKLKRLDIRFDNKCNLKCRICSSDYSTSWYSDEVKLGKKLKPISDVYNEVISPKVFDFIIEQLRNVDEIFFAGGEPLIQDGHYLILENAIKLGLEKKIRLTYNTNFSKLKYKNKNVISIWKKFKQVNIGASLDDSGDKLEYQRKNIINDDVLENIDKIKNIPNIDFNLIPTLSIFNVYSLPNYHKEWVISKKIKLENIQINPLTHPTFYNIQNLPNHHKDRIKKIYNNHIKWIESIEPDNKSKDEFYKIINYIDDAEFNYEKIKAFLEINRNIDKIRNESFFDVYPELSDLEYFIENQMLKGDLEKSYLENHKLKKTIDNIRQRWVDERTGLNFIIKEKESFHNKKVLEIKDELDILSKRIDAEETKEVILKHIESSKKFIENILKELKDKENIKTLL